jgi:hypothetical protein
VPRLLAQFNSALPLRALPFAAALESILIAGSCCALFALDFRTILRSDALRIVLCIFTAAALPEEELVGNLTNLQ